MTDWRPSIRRWIAPLIVAGAVSACDTVNQKVTDLFDGKIELACPSYNIVSDAAKRVRFRPGPGRDLIDVDTQVEVQDVAVECFSDISHKTRSGKMRVNVDVTFAARRGPANESRQVAFKYFVAVTDRADKILYREAFELGTLFPGNESQRILGGDRIKLNVPILSGQSGSNFRILVGLVLSREELEYNRQEREARTLIHR